MERLTYDFALGGNHCWQVKGADNLECREVCERQGDDGCKTCPIAKAFDRLAAIEDILGDEYDLDRLRKLMEADREGRCVVLQCKEGETIYRIGWRISGNHVIEERVFNLTYFKPDDFGKNIFLTREAAEAALAREKVCRDCKEGWAKPSTLGKAGERCSDTCERYKAALKGDQHG